MEWIQTYSFQFKFIVENDRNITEIKTILNKLDFEDPPYKILLIPQGKDSETLNKRTESLIALCKENGYRLCQRLHVNLFGDKRGT